MPPSKRFVLVQVAAGVKHEYALHAWRPYTRLDGKLTSLKNWGRSVRHVWCAVQTRATGPP